MRQFALQPFPGAKPLPRVEIAGHIGRSAHSLAVHYTVLAQLGDVAISAIEAMPVRTNGLWEETCLELFLAVRDSPHYWEFNLSPAGNWNVYRFAAYRDGMQEERAYSELPFLVEIQPKALSLALDAPLDPIAPAGEDLEVGICAVIRDRNGQLSYWALSHRGPRPDFHHRGSFTVRL
ncbi:MAG TPA: hypothetical protein DCE18_09480 [Syntrophobacteraceae bacterium]|nr:hypothetical protein [Syntrophobacteraceae bacterium]